MPGRDAEVHPRTPRLAQVLLGHRKAYGQPRGYPPPGERLTGLLEALPSEVNREVEADALAREVLSTSGIEGEILHPDQVRSCVAARFGLDAGKSLRPIPAVEGIVRIMVDATARYWEGLTEERLLGWHSWLFPTGRNGIQRVRTGVWRTGPASVVSGPVGRERVHFAGPEPGRIPAEMRAFLEWFNRPPETDGVIRAGTAHLWFVAMHSREDGNGRIAWAITDMALARSQSSPMRLYSMSHRILRERDAYCRALENDTRGTCDTTAWLRRFARCLGQAMDDALESLSSAQHNSALMERTGQPPRNHRQLRVLEPMKIHPGRGGGRHGTGHAPGEAAPGERQPHMPARTRRVTAKATGTQGHRTSDRTATSPDITAKSPGGNHPITGQDRRPRRAAGSTLRAEKRQPGEGHRDGPSPPPGPGENGPETTRFGAENREFSGSPEFDKKLHRSTGNLASFS